MRNWALLLLVAACSSGEQTDEQAVTEQTSISVDPLIISHVESVSTDDSVNVQFLLENTDERPLEPDDYEFDFPELVWDDADVPYSLIDTELSHDDLDDHELTLTLQLSPAPPEADTYVHLPFYLTPVVYEDGYTFQIEVEDAPVRQGDIQLSGLEHEETSLHFVLEDSHLQARQESVQYQFRLFDENEYVYPVFSSVEPYSGQTELTFAAAQELPVLLELERFPASLPVWRFSLTVPLT
ncbi:hypothetical protein [Alkalicoccus luteus]|uniref:Uncharacterized protein n=1 Tax=Alkalicoccus luteus TaxID=1237094 RepID=A0A969PWA7_9BACI|nr:hypothetical protein [Alkalicoccus luteus]NJP36812.1 hypothetical protein [Alkalicoccus luteus]